MSKTETNPEPTPTFEDNQGFQEQQGTQEQVIALSVDVNDFNVVMAGLQELPHRVVDPIIRKLVAQAQMQLQR